MVNDLADSPASIPVWSFQLLRIQPRDGLSHAPWCCRNVADPAISLCRGLRTAPRKFADRIPKIHQSILLFQGWTAAQISKNTTRCDGCRCQADHHELCFVDALQYTIPLFAENITEIG